MSDNYIWPSDFVTDAKTQTVIGAVPPPPIRRDDCENCGGRDTMFARYVTGGPYSGVPARGTSFYWEERKAWFSAELRSLPCPVCRGDMRYSWLMRQSGLEMRDLSLSIDRFLPHEGKENARGHAAELLALTPSPYGFTTFYGDYGVGKTMLLKLLVVGFAKAGVVATYRRMDDILDEVRETFSHNAPGASQALIDTYRSKRVLALDEIDRVNMTEWALETMSRLLDWRYEQSGTLLTLLATNRRPDEFTGALGYLSSRIAGGTPVEVGGDDMRAVQAEQARMGVME